MPNTKNRGFASMDPEQQKAIARKGGLSISQNREHMRTIGIKGGLASGKSRGGNKTLPGDVETSRD